MKIIIAWKPDANIKIDLDFRVILQYVSIKELQTSQKREKKI